MKYVKMISFAESIRQLRIERGYPLRKVAAFLEMDQGLLSKMERGIRKPGRELVIKIAKYYEVSEDELLASWLSDKVLYELKDLENPELVIKLAEEKIAYRRKVGGTRFSLMKNFKEVLSRYPGISKAWVFGSFARGEDREGSDIDILIEVSRKQSFTLFDIAEISNELTRACGRKVDVVLERALKPKIRQRIESDMNLFYEK